MHIRVIVNLLRLLRSERNTLYIEGPYIDAYETNDEIDIILILADENLKLKIKRIHTYIFVLQYYGEITLRNVETHNK